jgi:hypothetical protein
VQRYIMDTDHVSYILRGDLSVIENAKYYNAAITIITVQELFNGWVSRANDPKQVDRLSLFASVVGGLWAVPTLLDRLLYLSAEFTSVFFSKGGRTVNPNIF